MAKRFFKTVLPFVRHEDGTVTTIAIVELTTRKPVRQVSEKLGALSSAVTAWTKATKDGKECWKYSSNDLNIGDLASYEKKFRGWVKSQPESSLLADFEILWGGDTTGSESYDVQLVED